LAWHVIVSTLHAHTHALPSPDLLSSCNRGHNSAVACLYQLLSCFQQYLKKNCKLTSMSISTSVYLAGQRGVLDPNWQEGPGHGHPLSHAICTVEPMPHVISPYQIHHKRGAIQAIRTYSFRGTAVYRGNLLCSHSDLKALFGTTLTDKVRSQSPSCESPVCNCPHRLVYRWLHGIGYIMLGCNCATPALDHCLCCLSRQLSQYLTDKRSSGNCHQGKLPT